MKGEESEHTDAEDESDEESSIENENSENDEEETESRDDNDEANRNICDHCVKAVKLEPCMYLASCPKCSWKDFYKNSRQCRYVT